MVKILKGKSQGENKSQTSNDKNLVVALVKGNIRRLPKDIKDSPKKKKVIAERKNVFIVRDLMAKGLAEMGISKYHNVKIRRQPYYPAEDIDPVGNHMFKINNRSTRTRCKTCSKLTTKTPERCLASFWCLYC